MWWRCVIRLQPAIGELDATGQSALAIMALAVVLWVTDALPSGITAVLALGLLIIAGVPSNVALGGFATGAFWILVSVLFFGTAMDKTGPGAAISYRILLVFPPTYAGILVALHAHRLRAGARRPVDDRADGHHGADRVRAGAGRSTCRFPSAGAALIVLGAFEMAVLPGCAVLTGGALGAVHRRPLRDTRLPLTWFDYAQVMALPTSSGASWSSRSNLLDHAAAAARPSMSRDVVRTEMQQLGPMSRPSR